MFFSLQNPHPLFSACAVFTCTDTSESAAPRLPLSYNCRPDSDQKAFRRHQRRRNKPHSADSSHRSCIRIRIHRRYTLLSDFFDRHRIAPDDIIIAFKKKRSQLMVQNVPLSPWTVQDRSLAIRAEIPCPAPPSSKEAGAGYDLNPFLSFPVFDSWIKKKEREAP